MRLPAPAAVLPVMSPAEFEEGYAAYLGIQKVLDKTLKDAIICIQGKDFRKKAYWRALRTPFNLSCECVSEKRADLPGGEWGYEVTYRATAPNGAHADGDGACMSSEKNVYDRAGNLDAFKTQKNQTVHNVRGHAHTRAFNRAISNLVGFGEVSAEEVTRSYPGTAPAPSHSPEHEALANAAAAAMDGTPTIPPCPKCGAAMNERNRKDGKGRFYGCTKYPECKGTVPIHDTPEGQAKEAAKPQTKPPAQQSTLTAMTPEEKAEFTRIRKATGLEGLATWQAFLFTNKLPSTLATRNQVEAAYSALKKYQVELFTKDAESAPDAEQPPEKCPACDAAGKVRSASATEWVCEDCGAVWSKGQ
jgi:ssDNA-binding Zn-finger/Zn-ribbon topoisomerase 1